MKKLSALLFATLMATACSSKSDAPSPESNNTRPALPSALDDSRAHSAPAQTSLPKTQPAPIAKAEPAEEKPKTFRQHMRLGRKLMRAGDTDEAIALYEAARKMRPKSSWVRVELARTHLKAGNPDEARPHAEIAVELAPKSSYAWNTLGRVELAEHKLEAAEVSFRRATDEDEDNSYAWNNLGLTLIQAKRWKDASEALEHATSGKSPRAYMWNNLGMAYEHLDLLDRARAAYRQAEELGSGRARRSLARLEGVKSIKKAKVAEADTDDAETKTAEPKKTEAKKEDGGSSTEP
jgi:Flp pilus assembly protein TadD